MSWYFGADSGTSSNACGTDFYIGRLGGGTTADLDWAIASSSVKIAYTYWNIEGPGNAPASDSTDYEKWGSSQADAYWSRFKTFSDYQIGGFTLFGTVSYDNGDGGWSTDTITENREVVNGFLKQLSSKAGSDFTVGLDGSKDGELNAYLVDSYATPWTSPVPIVVWVADYPGGIDCSNASSAYCTDAATITVDGEVRNFTVGGYEPMIWQYHGDPDHDVTPYAGGITNNPPRWYPKATGSGICS